MIKKIKYDGQESIDTIYSPTASTFNEQYAKSNRPVKIKGLMDHWPALSKWTLDFFENEMGNYVCLADKSGNEGDYKNMSVRDYISYMKNCPDETPYYLSNTRFHLGTDMIHDYKSPEYFNSCHFLLPDEIRPIWSWLFFGAANSFTVLHVDVMNSSAWAGLISGRKTWLFFPQNQFDYIYNGAVDPFAPNYDKYPYFKKAKPIVCIQKPGEVVFVPSGWWHCVYNDEPGVSITENFINEFNFDNVMQTLKYRKMFNEIPVLESVMSEYLKQTVTA
jgi:histone arginine demethylase JMJD6